MTPTGPVDGSVALNGAPISKTATYRIVTNNFLSDGGDNFPAFTKGTNKYFGGLDIDAFANYLSRQLALHSRSARPDHGHALVSRTTRRGMPGAQHRAYPARRCC